jgi:hypothetical protein
MPAQEAVALVRYNHNHHTVPVIGYHLEKKTHRKQETKKNI